MKIGIANTYVLWRHREKIVETKVEEDGKTFADSWLHILKTLKKMRIAMLHQLDSENMHMRHCSSKCCGTAKGGIIEQFFRADVKIS